MFAKATSAALALLIPSLPPSFSPFSADPSDFFNFFSSPTLFLAFSDGVPAGFASGNGCVVSPSTPARLPDKIPKAFSLSTLSLSLKLVGP